MEKSVEEKLDMQNINQQEKNFDNSIIKNVIGIINSQQVQLIDHHLLLK
jgi:hypothetical protein